VIGLSVDSTPIAFANDAVAGDGMRVKRVEVIRRCFHTVFATIDPVLLFVETSALNRAAKTSGGVEVLRRILNQEDLRPAIGTHTIYELARRIALLLKIV
jgi:hypothetical protein